MAIATGAAVDGWDLLVEDEFTDALAGWVRDAELDAYLETTLAIDRAVLDGTDSGVPVVLDEIVASACR